MLAILRYRAAVALGRAGGAAIASEQDYAVAEVRLLFGRDKLGQHLFRFARILAGLGIKAELARNTDAVRVGNYRG